MIELFFLFSLISGQLVKIPLGYGGITILDLFILTTVIIYLWKTKLRLKTPPLFISMGIFFIFFAILSLLLSPLHLGLVENFISFSYIIRFFFYILFGWLLYSSNLVKARSEIFIWAGLFLSIIGIIQLIFIPDLRFLQSKGWDPHYFRTVSTFLDPNFLGAFLVLSLVPLTRKKATFLVISCFTIIFTALLTTFSRGSYLAFGVAFFSLSFFYKSKKLFVLTIFLLILLLASFSIYQQQISRPRNISREKSAEYRINSWEQGWQIFQQNPITGVGFNAYRFALKEYNLAPDQFTNSHGASSNDSSLLFVAATTGILGLLSYLFFLLFTFSQGQKNPIFLSGLLALITQSFFANTLFFPPILIWIILNAVWKKTE